MLVIKSLLFVTEFFTPPEDQHLINNGNPRPYFVRSKRGDGGEAADGGIKLRLKSTGPCPTHWLGESPNLCVPQFPDLTAAFEGLVSGDKCHGEAYRQCSSLRF